MLIIGYRNPHSRPAMEAFDTNKNRYLTFVFFLLITLLVILVACLFFLKDISKRQVQSADNRYTSFKIATSLRQSSDDLTRMVRQYVVTGDKKYSNYYNEILTIRNGHQARPVCYDAIYWDLVTNTSRPCPDGEKKSIVELMIEHGFTLSEFQLLNQSLSMSNQLVLIETTAMNAMEGKYQDSYGGYTIKRKADPEYARNLVFGKEYMDQKAIIMEPLQKFFQNIDQRTNADFVKYNRELNSVISITIILSFIITLLMIYSIYKAIKYLTDATRENEMLLLNVLPQPIADRLKGGEKTIADEFPQASVLFADIVGFTAMTHKIGATKMVSILNQLFDSFDDLTEKLGVEKVKTIGDSYMAVSGVPTQIPDHAQRLADFALGIQVKIEEFNSTHNTNLQVRIGMTFGSVVAGVIGHKKFIYDVWGDVVNTASRMESASLPGEIQITEKMAYMLEDNYIIVEREEIEIKGRAPMTTYFLKGKKLRQNIESIMHENYQITS